MDQSSRTFRVFVIPQTFTDFTEERNALQREVFPKLRQLCEEHGFRFQAIDLRWGVREEAALESAVRIALDGC
jgi:NACHT domain- and WD repeat-containing protein